MEVLVHRTVDSHLWADAVKWLLLYGPPPLREMLEQAASVATAAYFPDLVPTGFNDQGQPCYDVEDLARALRMSSEEATDLLGNMEEEYGEPLVFDKSDTHEIQ